MMNLRAVLVLTWVFLADAADTTTATTATTAKTTTAKVDCSADKNNGFAKNECGTKDDIGHTCCHPSREVCVNGKAKAAKKTSYACSKSRALFGVKLVKVIFIPMFSLAFLAFALIYMVRQLKDMKPKPPLNILCILQVVLAALVVCSTMWKFALYSAFLAVAVFTFMREFANKWIVMAFIALQFFNVLAMNGAVDKANGVFLPLGFLAADNVASWEKGILADKLPTGAACSTAYDNYFTLESVETAAEGMDPYEKYFGFCTEPFLGAVGTCIGLKMVFQLVMVVLSFRLLIPKLGGAAGKAGLIISADEEKQAS